MIKIIETAQRDKLLIFIWVFLLMGVHWEPVLSNNIKLNDKNKNEISMDSCIFHYEDEYNFFTIEDFLYDPTQFRFDTIYDENCNFGFSSSTHWFRFVVENNSSLNKDMVFCVLYPLLNEVDFYETASNHIVKKFATGDTRKFETRKINNRNFIFEVKLPPYEYRVYYVRVKNFKETIRVPMKLYNKNFFFYKDSIDLANMVLYYGVLIFSLIFNVFLFLSFRDKVYLYFSLYILFLSLFFLNIDGLSFQLFWPGLIWFANHSTIMFISLAMISLTMFTRHYLRLKENFIHHDNIVKGILFYVSLLFFLSFIPHPYFPLIVKTVNFTALIITIAIIVIGIRVLFSKFLPARLFLISFSMLLFGVCLYVLRNSGILPNNMLTQYGVRMGLAVQILFLSIAVIDRFKRIMINANARLEFLVKERTAQLEEQRKQLEIQHVEITDSIKYAKRIQTAMLPDKNSCDLLLDDYFIFFRPRDIVSGDFYWITKRNSNIYIVCADCTGHGVPGAFMSMLGISFLNEIVGDSNAKQPGSQEMPASGILKTLTDYMINTLSNAQEKEKVKDSMDMALCIVNTEKQFIEFAGANNPLYFFSKGKLTVYKGTKLTIGVNVADNIEFENIRIPYIKGDAMYLFTDGYIDQFDELSKKSFRSRRFRDMLTEIHTKPMTEQKQLVEDNFHNWKKNSEQIDDVLVIGVRL